MKKLKSGIFGIALGALIGLLSAPVIAQTCPAGGSGISCEPQGDIDLFTNNPNSSADNPNILFVLDNTANWSGNDQKFPGGKQGVAELQSIKIALGALGAKGANINVGIMAFPAGETGSGTHGGYIRSAVRPMAPANFATFSALLDHMSANFDDSQRERQNSNLFYGNLMADAHNYFKGLEPIAQSSAVANTGNADPAGYDVNYTKFKAPPTGTGCGNNYIVFIANPNSNGPATDDVSNTDYLRSLGGDAAIVQPPHALFGEGDVTTDLGLSANCYAQSAAGAASCTSTETGGTFADQCDTYESCACDGSGANSSSALSPCPAGTRRYTVNGIKNSSSTNSAPPPGPIISGPTANQDTGSFTACTADAASPIVLAAQFACSKNAPGDPASPSCPAGTTCTVQSTGVNCGGQKNYWNYISTTYTPAPPASATCPATSVVTSGSNPTTTTTTSWTNCTANEASSSTAGCGENQHKFAVFGTKTDNAYETTISAGQTVTPLGNTFACYASLPSCSTSGFSQAGYDGLVCANPGTTTGSCPNSTIRFQVQGANVGVAPTGTNGFFQSPKFVPLNANLWARYMNQNGIASTYTIDVYNAKPSRVASELYNSMAKLGGGKYYAAQNQAAIVTALTNILDEIQSVNSNFSSAALPISATNRAQNVNQVYIGMFRPNADADPRWHGNLKRYKLIQSGGGIVLADVNNAVAVSASTGFVGNCATSSWTTDSGNYWEDVPANKPPARGVCPTSANDPWSDAPDGPFVEKGGVAEVLRKGNGSAASPPPVNRNFWTLDVGTGSLVPFTSGNTGLSANAVEYIIGRNTQGEKATGTTSEPRPTIHGDVIHSRPLPVNYTSTATPNPSTPIAVYYGSNDGTYRGIDAATGRELWAFVAPETTTRLNRLVNNAPKVLLYGSGTASSPTPKDYFFDGSTGIYQPADNSKVWIFPTMNRGGRMVYALDVTNPTAPVYKWRAGCPSLTDDSECTTDSNGVVMDEIGQTWSFPNVASIKGYAVGGGTYPPVIIMGGGYDRCQDANIASPSCGSSKGRVLYVLDANTGTVLRKFTTTGGISADVSLVDVNNDGLVDYAYAAGLDGNIWRIHFADAANSHAPLTTAEWGITRVAYTSGGGRKFLHGAAVLPASNGSVYLALGSGDREHPLINQYPYPGVITTDGVQNRFYVYLDSLTRTTATNLDDSTFLPNYDSATCDTAKLLPGGDELTGQRGWFINLDPGEQTVTSGAIVGGMVAFSTNLPTDPQAGSCSSLGNAYGYLVGLFNGSGAIGVTGTCGGDRRSIFVGGSLPPSPVIANVQLDDGTVHTVLLGAAQKDGTVSSTLQSQDVNPPISPIRKGVYWRRSGDN